MEDQRKSVAEILQLLPTHLLRQSVVQFLCLKSLVRLDTAFASAGSRTWILQTIATSSLAARSTVISERNKYALRWLHRRSIGLRNVTLLLDEWGKTFPRFLEYPCRTRELTLVHNATTDTQIGDEDYLQNYLQLVQVRLYEYVPWNICCLAQLVLLEATRCNALTDTGVTEICAGCRKLQHILFEECSQISRLSVVTVADSYPELLTLHVRGPCRGLLDDSCVEAVAYNCRTLQSVVIAVDHSKIADSSIVALVSGCRKLRKLAIKSHNMSDAVVTAIGACCPHLESLAIMSDNCLADASLCTIGSALPHLRSLRIDLSMSVTVTGLIALLQGCGMLTSLVLTGEMYLPDQVIGLLAPHLSHLHTFGLPFAEYVTDKSIEYIATHCRHLRKLSVEGCHSLSYKAFYTLAQHCRELQVLHAGSGWHVMTDDALEALALNCCLTEVDISYCNNVTEDGVNYLLQHCPIRYLLVDCGPDHAIPKRLQPPMGDCDMDRFE